MRRTEKKEGRQALQRLWVQAGQNVGGEASRMRAGEEERTKAMRKGRQGRQGRLVRRQVDTYAKQDRLRQAGTSGHATSTHLDGQEVELPLLVTLLQDVFLYRVLAARVGREGP